MREVRPTPREKRQLVTIAIGVSSPMITHSWDCAACGYQTQGGESDRTRVTREMRAHDCNGIETAADGETLVGVAGWCPWSAPTGTERPSWPVPERYVPPAIAARYAAEREARKTLS